MHRPNGKDEAADDRGKNGDRKQSDGYSRNGVTTNERISLACLSIIGFCLILSVGAMAILSINGQDIPPELAALCGTCSGGLTGIAAAYHKNNSG